MSCKLTVVNKNSHHTNVVVNDTIRYQIDTNECPEAYALIMVLTDWLGTFSDKNLSIHVNNIQTFNILTRHLYEWKQNHWMRKNMTPVPFVDILQEFADAIEEKKISYQVFFDSGLNRKHVESKNDSAE